MKIFIERDTVATWLWSKGWRCTSWGWKRPNDDQEYAIMDAAALQMKLEVPTECTPA